MASEVASENTADQPVPQDKVVEKITLDDLSTHDGKSAEEYIKEARECYTEQQDYHKAAELADMALKLDSSILEGVIIGARASTNLKKYEDAYNFYKIGLKIDPNQPTIVKDLKELQKLILADYEKLGGEEMEKGYSALKLCGQDIYPGDDELLRLEYEIIEKKYKIDTKPTGSRKNNQEIDETIKQRAAKAAMAAHNYMLMGKYSEAINHFTKTLEMQPNNTIMTRLRAEAYFINGQVVEALKDLWSIPKSERTVDAWKLGGKILAQLNLPVSAEFWLRKASTLAQGKDEETLFFFQKVRVRRLYDPLTEDQPVHVDFTEYGRAIFAKEDAKNGDVIFSDNPIVLGRIFDKQKVYVSACEHCAKSLLSPADYFKEKLDTFDNDMKDLIKSYWPKTEPVLCHSCNIVTYCSEACRQEAWDSYHEIICPARSEATKKLNDIAEDWGFITREDGTRQEIWDGHYSPIILARIWGNIASVAKILMKEEGLQQPTANHWATAKSPYRKFIAYGNSYVSDRMPEILKLMQDIFSDCGDGVKMEISPSEFNGRYYQATCNLQSFSGPVTPYHEFLNNLSQNTDPNDTRPFIMLKHLQEPPNTANFCGIFPLHACLNHSCLNNVEVCDGEQNGRPGVSVRARTDIEAKEELFTTYIDTRMPRKLRRAWLYKSFNFWCQCPRCLFEGDDPDVCTNCKKKSEDSKKFPACGKCHKAWYCSTKCQKKAWSKGHKIICNAGHSKTCG